MTEQTFPWSVRVATADVPPDGLHRNLAAGPAELAALASAAEVEGIASLTASFDIKPEHGESFRVTGIVRGEVSQTCVVTLEPLRNEIEEEVDVIFAPEQEAEAARARLAKADEEGEGSSEDPPEPIRGGTIDLGQLAAEFFVLGIDPYPRRPGAAFQAVFTPPDPADHPFAGLAALKGRAEVPSNGPPKGKGKPKNPV